MSDPGRRASLFGRRVRLPAVAAVVVAVFLVAELWARAVGPHLPPADIGDPPEMSLKVERMAALGRADVVLLGNSLVDHGIDPAALVAAAPGLGSAYNAALAGAPVVGMTRWATRFVVPALHPTTVVVGLHPISLLDINLIDALTAGGADASALQVIDNTFLATLDRLDPGPLQRAEDRAGDLSALVRYRTTLRNPVDAWRGTVAALEGKARPASLARVAEADGGLLVARDRAFWQRSLTPAGFAAQLGRRRTTPVVDSPAVELFRSSLEGSNASSADLRTLLQTLRRRVDRVVVAVLPLAPGVTEAIGPKARARLARARALLDEVAGDQGVRVVDLTGAPVGIGDFADPVHMNVLGARIVGRQLGVALS